MNHTIELSHEEIFLAGVILSWVVFAFVAILWNRKTNREIKINRLERRNSRLCGQRVELLDRIDDAEEAARLWLELIERAREPGGVQCSLGRLEVDASKHVLADPFCKIFAPDGQEIASVPFERFRLPEERPNTVKHPGATS